MSLTQPVPRVTIRVSRINERAASQEELVLDRHIAQTVVDDGHVFPSCQSRGALPPSSDFCIPFRFTRAQSFTFRPAFVRPGVYRSGSPTAFRSLHSKSYDPAAVKSPCARNR